MNSYELTDRDAELLSAYMDNQLDAEQRSVLEARLAAEPDLRRELRSLQQTVALVREMPTLRAPRDFTLTRDMVQPTAPQVLPSKAAPRPSKNFFSDLQKPACVCSGTAA